jgi:hypothetical protein
VLAGAVEATVKYHPFGTVILTEGRETGLGTVAGGQFDWGGRLPKSNGGVQRFPQGEYKSPIECKGRRELDCEADEPSRYESRA